MKGKRRKAQQSYTPTKSLERLGWSLAAAVSAVLVLLVGRYGW